MLIILVGIPGSGKSTALKALQERCPSIRIVNYGEVMLQEAALHGLDRDSLRKLSVDEQQKIGLAASLKIASQQQGLTLVDTHACVRTPVGYCPGIPLKILNALRPKALILVEASPSIIVSRREKDNSRKRDAEELHELNLHQELTKAYLASASTMTGAILCVINNDGERISENIQPLVKLIEVIF